MLRYCVIVKLVVKSCILFFNCVFKQKFSAAGIGAALHYPRPLHLQKGYGFLDLKEGSYPVAEKAAESVLSLPNYLEMTDEMVEYVTETVKEASLL